MTTPAQGPSGEMRRRLDDEFLTRREAEAILSSSRDAYEAAKEAHDAVHSTERDALLAAMSVQDRDRKTHEANHDREHELHAEKHGSEKEAIKTALDSVSRERTIHAEAHEREHISHGRVHDLGQIAVTKAEVSVEDRLKAMNEFRGQLRDQQATFVSREVVDNLAKEIDRRFNDMSTSMITHFQSAEKLTQDRYEANRASILALEKSDVKSEGRGIGQGAVIAAMVTAIGVVGGLLGIVVVLSNLLTSGPA
jgi:hypothetical protein